MTRLTIRLMGGVNYLYQHDHIRNLMASVGYHRDTFDIIYVGYHAGQAYDLYKVSLDAELTESQMTWLRLKLADNLLEDDIDTHS